MAEIYLCFNAGNITSVKYAAGIIANVPSGKTSNITNCFNTGVISGTTASGLAIGTLIGTSTVSNFYDLNNPSVTSLAGAKSGTLNATNAYSYGETVSTTANDASKVSKDTLKGLKSTLGNKWTVTNGYNYPDLVNNSIVKNKPANFNLSE